RVIDRDLDHIYAKERRFRVLERGLVRAALELLAGTDAARAGSVDIDVTVVIGIGDHRMGVRASARLHCAHLLRHAYVADVEDTDAEKALPARRARNALQAAVEPPARLLDRIDQQIVDDGHV